MHHIPGAPEMPTYQGQTVRKGRLGGAIPCRHRHRSLPALAKLQDQHGDKREQGQQDRGGARDGLVRDGPTRSPGSGRNGRWESAADATCGSTSKGRCGAQKSPRGGRDRARHVRKIRYGGDKSSISGAAGNGGEDGQEVHVQGERHVPLVHARSVRIASITSRWRSSAR